MNRIHRSAGLRSFTTLLQATTAEEQQEEALRGNTAPVWAGWVKTASGRLFSFTFSSFWNTRDIFIRYIQLDQQSGHLDCHLLHVCSWDKRSQFSHGRFFVVLVPQTSAASSWGLIPSNIKPLMYMISALWWDMFPFIICDVVFYSFTRSSSFYHCRRTT